MEDMHQAAGKFIFLWQEKETPVAIMKVGL